MGNIFLQLATQQCCVASWKALLHVLPPTSNIVTHQHFVVASWKNWLKKVNASSTCCNEILLRDNVARIAPPYASKDRQVFSAAKPLVRTKVRDRHVIFQFFQLEEEFGLFICRSPWKRRVGNFDQALGAHLWRPSRDEPTVWASCSAEEEHRGETGDDHPHFRTKARDGWTLAATGEVDIKCHPSRARNWQALPFLASRHTSTILITPFHLTISPLFRPVILLLILNLLSEKAYLFPNSSLLSTKTSHPHHFLYFNHFLHRVTWHFNLVTLLVCRLFWHVNIYIYTITWLLCTFSLVVARDLLEDRCTDYVTNVVWFM